MSTVSDYSLANQGFSAFRTELNNILGAINTHNLGTSAPSSLAAGSIWVDSSSSGTHTLKYYDGSDSITLCDINTSANTVNFIDSTVASDLLNDSSPQLGANLDTNSFNILIDDAHFIADENGNEQIIFQTTSSAVNQFDITNAATGNAPEIASTGGDTNIDLKLTPKGSGQVVIDGNVGIDTGVIDLKNGGSQSVVRFYCESSNAHYAQIQAPAHSDFSGNVTLTLPASTDTLTGIAATQTLTNKTLTTPIIAEIDSGSTITLDATTDIILDADGANITMKDGGTTVLDFVLNGATDVTLDAPGDLKFDADGGDFNFLDGGTEILRISNSSSDVIIRPVVDAKDLIFQQRDGTEVARIEDNGTFNVVTDKLAINGTAVTSTAAELNILDGVTATATEINLIDGDSSAGTTAVADADGIITNDGGTMRLTTAATFKTYFQQGISSAADDISAGDAAVNLTTTSGNITIDAAANDTDIIFKGTDDSSDITMLTLDGSDAGSATFNDKVTIGDGKLVLNSTAVTSTAAELNLLDGVSGLVQADLTKLAAVDSTAAELNIVDGGTSATSTTLVDADRVVVNDNGTMVQVAMSDVKTYIGGGTSWQAIKTSNFTASAGQGIFANTTSSAFTVTLPSSPSLGDEVTIVDYAGTFDSNSLTVGRNSEPIQGVAEDLVVSTERASFTLVYVDGTQGWLFKND